VKSTVLVVLYGKQKGRGGSKIQLEGTWDGLRNSIVPMKKYPSRGGDINSCRTVRGGSPS